MRPIAYLTTRIRNGVKTTCFEVMDGLGMQEILAHDTEAVMALQAAEEENKRLRQRVAMLEKLVRAGKAVSVE